ncbi:hypothetical protein IMG5_058570 [Ichthyophthirius multifiliis]|uniref:Uncharacterized protein n=1 Tax=Ichthyophthirius multifiliis TaxID=5932 RepID=G0QNH5_ICHMU|nr:hypothetical protein IMG5_058570 [Ichthyophthirius multifiliis]EGR33237.1 hypothetical protein IMG5_058570 [Ichthyophthirius multifiliis]|eukprot:XP_004037223.1 hypothetical protein IMG5_058570 [Ichthyophthirius multifiliis]
MKEMGIYATRQQPLKIIEEQKKKQEEITKKRQTQANYIAPRQKTRIKLDKSRNVLNTDIDATILYKPKTKENRVQYEFILSTINQILLDSPPDVLRSVTDEVLAVLKSDDQKDKDKKQDLEGMLGPIKQELYDQLLNAAKMINDYHQSMEDNQLDDNDQRADIDQTFGLDEEEDEEDNFANNQDIQLIEQDKQDDDESEEEDQNGSQNNLEIKAKANMEMDAEDLNENNDLFYVDIRTIDPYWLQTKLNEAFKDPVQAQKLDKQVLQILHSENDINCENQLVMLLDYENFDLIKLLLKNRHKIYYCTLLGRAEDEQERQQVLDQMSKTEAGEKVLEQLRNIDKKVKQESNLRSKNNKANDIKQGKDIEQEDMQDYLTASKITDEEFNKLSKKILDLENLVFQQGSHFMSNEKCKPPDNTKKFSFKGYDEIYVPATKHTDIAEKKKISSLPKWAQLAFKDFEELNPIQTKVCDTALNSPENMLICAPTGAGKTNVALLTMLQVIGRYIKRDGTIDTSKFKIVYIAPMKALVSEMVLSFHKRLEKYGIVVKELTGDSQLSKEQIEETQLIIATPEKWDIVTRKSGDRTYTELVKLLIIDEIHLLHDSRGPVLESIVARTIRMIEQTQEMVRIVGLSATLPNYNDVATFIRVNVRSGLFYFDHTYRPIPLEQVYVGITEKKAVKRMMLMNEILYEKVVQRASSDKPMIIFVHSRRETVKTANYLREIAYSKDDLGKFLTQYFFYLFKKKKFKKSEGSDSQTVLQSVAEKAQNKQLKEMLPFGFGIHHAGLNRADRNLVESLFFQRHLRVLVSTATLAWGVNLPAHTVIIKGTQIYSPEQGKWTELSPQDILQMIGRAGRPSFDRKGEGIILTTYTELKYYLSLLNQQLPIESQFLCQLPDQLNAEVVLGTISNVKDAVDWLGYTYLYIRMLRRPDLYSIPFEEFEEDRLLVRHRANLVHSAATLLDKYGLVKYDRKTGILQATSLGKIASHYYIKYPSMEIYNKHLKLNMGVVEIFKVFSLSNEFKFIPIREEEKGELQKLMDTVPIPIKGSPEDPAIKINILLQAYIGRLKLDGFALNSDMIYITQSAGRIVRAMFEICLKKDGLTQPKQLLQCVKWQTKECGVV